MSRVSRSVVILSLFAAVFWVAVPAQAAVPQSVVSLWSWLLHGWASWTAALTEPNAPEGNALLVAVGEAGASVSIDGFAGVDDSPGTGTYSTELNALDPDELPTEAGPKISIDG